MPQRGRGPLIEQNPHEFGIAISRNRETLFRVLQHCFGLLASNPRKPFEEIVEPRAVLEVREKCLNRHARSSEDPRAADLLRRPLDSGAVIPIEHVMRLADAFTAGKLPRITSPSS